MADAWPTEIRLQSSGRILSITFETEKVVNIAAELLRVESPSAEVKGHGPGQETLVLGKEQIRIVRIEPIGTYAVRLIFDDSHSTGIFTWAYLYKLGTEGEALMAKYQEQVSLAKKHMIK